MENQTDKQRPIDKLRNGAGSLEIRTPDDDSAISELISTGDRLLEFKAKGIYEIKLADQVDPERMNVATPNTIQRVIPYGLDAPWVSAVILTAHHLFQSSCSPSEIDGVTAFALVLKMAEDIAGAHQLEENYRKAEEVVTKNLDPKIRKDRSFVVPALGNVESRCNEWIMHCGNCSDLFECSTQTLDRVAGRA